MGASELYAGCRVRLVMDDGAYVGTALPGMEAWVRRHLESLPGGPGTYVAVRFARREPRRDGEAPGLPGAFGADFTPGVVAYVFAAALELLPPP